MWLRVTPVKAVTLGACIATVALVDVMQASRANLSTTPVA
jgi:hypothetical protein